ncbi:hypothetical protein H4219_000188 [Mycoemilia scoparia]|uniref:Uncharacterized protein n=1 Tax=Mycoemilia scoparia TaxID=417184 RepID=A0A9W8A9J9_9FUNG|nr:hypothetical protein H4219_000188 [Mycoemilia scoparia]
MSSNRSIWEIYKGLQPKTRIYIGLGFMGLSIAGMYISDRLEEIYPADENARAVQINKGPHFNIPKDWNTELAIRCKYSGVIVTNRDEVRLETLHATVSSLTEALQAVKARMRHCISAEK